MGEVVLSSEDAGNLQVKEVGEKKEEEENGTAESPAVVRWERFLPKMALRVLLVEADDSTRQIIAALLRKCSYRVAAVPDGLKAWEVLKGKSDSIDLILTEVDLPSISGFALLTLIMEHDVCKNIPVIMMSCNDSVNVVYKCMMRGAADFLVKPVRKNELRNLWQHVWRRQVSNRGGNGLLDESVAQQKVEVTAENNASNHSSGYMACVQRNRECIEKGSDAQSSCTKPDLETERECAENIQNLSQPDQSKSPADDVQLQKHDDHAKSSRDLLMHDCEDRGLLVATCKEAIEVTEREGVATEIQRQHSNSMREALDNNLVLVSSTREAIDLMGAFDNYPKCTYRASGSNNCVNKNDSSLLLDLSLKRYPSGSVNQVGDERHTLNHSDASAFSRYVNKAVQPRNSSASICNQPKDNGATSDRLLSNHSLDCNAGNHGLVVISPRNILSMASGQSGQAEVAFPSSQQTVLSVPIPVRGVRFDNLSTAYGSVVSPMFCTQSGPSTLQSPVSSRHHEPSFQANSFHPSGLERKNSQQDHNPIDQNPNYSSSQTEDKERHKKFESSEDQIHISPTTDQSVTSSFCIGNANNINTIGSLNNGNVDQAVVARTVTECGNECLSVHDRTSHRSFLREAALTKFRLKRKERCYEKKVRYESRKKLAEQRPRVKGQFVRQIQPEPVPAETDSPHGNSLDG